MIAIAGPVGAEPLTLKTGATTFTLDPATLRIDVMRAGKASRLMPPLHDAEAVSPEHVGKGWRWKDMQGRTFIASIDNDALRLLITAPTDQTLDWPLPPAEGGTWLVPDGEGMAFQADDPFWRQAHKREKCFDAVAGLSFPAWSYLKDDQTLTYALGDGLRSELCLKDENGLQSRIKHSFDEGADSFEILFSVGDADPLAPALAYRRMLKARGQFRTFADKAVPDLEKLYGAPQAYVWGDGRDLVFLDELKALGIERINLSYDQNPQTNKHLVTPDYLRKAQASGYLAGPYDVFDNGQPPGDDASPYVLWDKDLYPSGCVQDAAGKPVTGFAGMGCEMSSEAIVRAPGPFVPGARYARHRADGARQVFVDVDAYGEFYHDYSPDHPMTMSRDRLNRLARLDLGMRHYKLVMGSENVTAWSAGVVHYSHGTAQAHVSTVWKVKQDNARFGGWWPADRLPVFFKTFPPTPDESRLLFGASDRLPLFEAVFHDSVIASDRWEFGLMKVADVEGLRFARALLFGTPTLWPLDRQELRRIGPWLKAAHDDFRLTHGWDAPVALTGFTWETPDRLVQTTRFADGKTITANFGPASFQDLATNCVRVKHPAAATQDFCPPPLPAP
jgi:hypothetical protein